MLNVCVLCSRKVLIFCFLLFFYALEFYNEVLTILPLLVDILWVCVHSLHTCASHRSPDCPRGAPMALCHMEGMTKRVEIGLVE